MSKEQVQVCKAYSYWSWIGLQHSLESRLTFPNYSMEDDKTLNTHQDLCRCVGQWRPY